MASLASTRAFINALNEDGIKWTENDPDDDENIKIVWTWEGGRVEFTFLTCFNKSSDGRTASEYCFGVYKANLSDARNYVRMLDIVNQVNNKWRWVLFSVNREKGQVNAGYDISFGKGSASPRAMGEIALYNHRQFKDIVYKAYEFIREHF